MSKRKQVKPSKFDLGKKDEPAKSVAPIRARDDVDKAIDCLDSDRTLEEPDTSSDLDQEVDPPKANFARVVSIRVGSSTVIQSVGRKRSLSMALDSAVIRRGPKAGIESEETEGCDKDTIGNGSPVNAPMKPVERVSVVQEVEEARKHPIAVTGSPNHSREHAAALPIGAKQLERVSSNAHDPAEVSKLIERRHLVKCFVCPYCETGFSNPKTLEAHQTIYCTKKPVDGKVSTITAKRARLQPPNSPSQSQSVAAVDSMEPRVSSARIERKFSTVPTIRVTSPDFAAFQTPLATPSVILLPCAYNSSNVIQIIGRPQTIIPVAIPRSVSAADFTTTPLLLEESWCAGIDTLRHQVPLTSSNGHAENSGFTLPLATRTSHEGQAASASQHSSAPRLTNGQSRPSVEDFQKRPSGDGRNRSPPLDLTKKFDTDSPPGKSSEAGLLKRRSLPQLTVATTGEPAAMPPNTAPTPPTAGSAAPHPKNHACPKCGVAFSSKKTLEGHQAYYCKAAASEVHRSDTSPIVQKESANPSAQTLCCQYCDQSTTTVWQLLQHMKTTHSLGVAYLCTLCGYRGFSMRGMKSHLKHAHADAVTTNTVAVNDEETIVSKYVKRTKLFDEYDTPEPEEDASRSSDSHSEIDVDDCCPHSDKSERPSTPMDKNKKVDAKLEPDYSINGQKRTSVGDSQASTSASCPLISKYACQFCAYRSPYKGNVKRHLSLVHKMEKQQNNE